MKNNVVKNCRLFLQKILFSSPKISLFLIIFLFFPLLVFAGEHHYPAVFNIRLEFIIFGFILIFIALFHKKTFLISVIGLSVIIIYKYLYAPVDFGIHFFGSTPLTEQLQNKDLRSGEWGIILNLLGLLLGFAILAKLFEESGIPDILPDYLPDNWKGPFVLLVFVFILSAFLDNIAAAMIGGTIAMIVFKHKVHIGFIAAIVAAANAGGSGSVVGDTTTTMMWIDGVSALNVMHAYIAAVTAFLFFAWFSSKQQDKYERIQKDATTGVKIDVLKLLIVLLILAGAVVSNIFYDMPALGVWIAIIAGSFFRKIPWSETRSSLKGTLFLLALVTSASLMPVETLPDASWQTAFILGFVSSVFDNIPLTKLCLEQGHFDWGMLAYTVGFGGSLIWFGSSAGVAITNKFPEARNVFLWIRKSWYIIIAYIIGFFVLFAVWGWVPSDNNKHKEPARNCPHKNCPLAGKLKQL